MSDKIHASEKFWESYGFRGNPYDQSPLKASADTLLPISQAFIERDGEYSQQMAQFLNNPASNISVEGELGIGKTTFVNHFRYLWHAQKRLFTPMQEIPIMLNWGIYDTLIHVLGALAHKFLLLFGQQKVDQNSVLRGILQLSQSFAPQNKAKKNKRYSYSNLLAYYQRAVDYLLSIGYDGVVIHFENLELFGHSEPEQLRQFLEQIATLLELPGIYNIFTGHPGFFSEIVAPVDRVCHLFYNCPIYLDALSEQKVSEIIQRRYQLLSQGNFLAPVDEQCIRYLHQIYQGKIAAIMETLHQLAGNIRQYVPQTIHLETMQQMLPIIVEEKINWLLTEKEKKILREITLLDDFTAPDLCSQLGMKKQNTATYLTTLSQHDFIYPCGREGKTVVYRVKESLKWLTGTPEIPKQTMSRQGSVTLTQRQNAIMNLYRHADKLTSQQISDATGIKVHNVRRELKVLTNIDYLQSHGQTRNQYYMKKGVL